MTILICNPDEPGWFHGEAHVGSIADVCHHPIRISAAGVGMLLVTPGLQTCCIRCIPSDAEYGGILPEIRQQFEEETGQPLTGDLEAKAQLIVQYVAKRNRR